MRKSKYLKIQEIQRYESADGFFYKFKIVEQSHRKGEFGGKVNMAGKFVDHEEFVAKNGVHIISRGMISSRPHENTLFVRGDRTEYDNHVVSAPAWFYHKICAAIDDYNATFMVGMNDLDVLFELE